MVEVETNAINQSNVQSEQGLTVFQGNGIIWFQLVNTETCRKYFYIKTNNNMLHCLFICKSLRWK